MKAFALIILAMCSVAGAALPPAPSTMTAVPVSASLIKLAWKDNSANETSFQIYRSNDGVTFGFAATAGVNQTSYTSSGLKAATKYYYKVRAVNGTGASAFSNIASAVTLAAPTPTPTATPSATPRPTITPTPTASATPTATPTSTPTPSPSPSPSPTVSVTFIQPQTNGTDSYTLYGIPLDGGTAGTWTVTLRPGQIVHVTSTARNANGESLPGPVFDYTPTSALKQTVTLPR